MGFFENLGRKVERFKQDVEEAATEEADFVCTACGEPVFAEADACSACGSEAIEPIRSSPDDGSSDDPDHDSG